MPYYNNSQGLDIYYEEKGKENKKSIIFLNGAGSNHHMYDSMVNVLKDKYHCVTIDYRGYGSSAKSRFNSMAWCAFDVKELIEHLELNKVTLIGNSMGISVLLAYFKAYGSLYVDRIIMCDQSPYVTSDKDWSHGRLRGRQDKDMFLKFVAEMFHDPDKFMIEELERMSPRFYTEVKYPEEILSNDLFDYSWIPEEDNKKTFIFNKKALVAKGMKQDCDQLAYIATWFDSGYQDYRPVIPNIKVPALVFAPYPGTEYDFESSEYYRDHLGGPVKFEVLEPATHLAMFEHFQECIEKIVEFMETNY